MTDSETDEPSARRSPGLPIVYLAVPCLLAAVYVFSFRFNGFLDLPNHLARAQIMLSCFHGSGPELCTNYEIGFVPIPFLFADMTLIAALAVFPPLIGEKVAVFFLLLLTTAGWFALYNRVNGSRPIGYLAGLILLLNNFLYNGFYAYLMSIALALLWLSYWWGTRDRKRMTSQLALAVGMALIFGFHLAGFLLVFLVYGLYDVHKYLMHRSPHLREWWISSLRGLPVIATFASLYVYQQLASGQTVVGGGIEYKPLLRKLATVLYPFINFSKPLDLALAVSVMLFLLLAVPGRRFVDVARSFWGITAIAFFVAFLLLPTAAHGVYDFDVRFLPLAYFSLFLALGRFARTRTWNTVGVVGSLLASFAAGLYFKSQVNKELATVERVLNLVPRGAALVQVNSRKNFPDPERSRVSPFAYFGSYHASKGGSLVGGLFDCQYNRNLAYFCYEDPALSKIDHQKFQFVGTTALTSEDLAFILDKFDYVMVTGHRPDDPALRKYDRHNFRLLAQSDDVSLFVVQARHEEPPHRGSD